MSDTYIHARKMADDILRVRSSVDCIRDMVADGTIPNAIYGEIHKMSLTQLLEEIERGIRAITNHRSAIMELNKPVGSGLWIGERPKPSGV